METIKIETKKNKKINKNLLIIFQISQKKTIPDPKKRISSKKSFQEAIVSLGETMEDMNEDIELDDKKVRK